MKSMIPQFKEANSPRSAKAFTLVELLVVIAIIGILAALLQSVLGLVKARGVRIACLNNLKQLSLGVHMYAGDYHDTLLAYTNTDGHLPWFNSIFAYDPLIRRYVGLTGAPSPQDKLFSCPADTYYYVTDSPPVRVLQSWHLQSNANYSSYAFNGANAFPILFTSEHDHRWPGILGHTLSSIANPSKTVLITEFPAYGAYSWHRQSPSRYASYNNAPNNIGFADGHVSYTKVCLPNGTHSTWGMPDAFSVDPPANYDYKWSGN
jgi:prepilin-type N-terminal cleavage/methylation domain-containing protein/prepilin-type processing-associated H-X9-DG protein